MTPLTYTFITIGLSAVALCLLGYIIITQAQDLEELRYKFNRAEFENDILRSVCDSQKEVMAGLRGQLKDARALLDPTEDST